MKIVHPIVVLLAETQILDAPRPQDLVPRGVFQTAVGASEWDTNAETDGEMLIEMAGLGAGELEGVNYEGT